MKQEGQASSSNDTQAVLGELNENSKFIAWVTGQDGYGTNRLRGYAEEASEWSFGGGDESSPKVMDMIVPEGMKHQYSVGNATCCHNH